MAEVTETALPGVGVRHEFTASSGERVAVVSHRGGWRDIVVYGREDPDACSTVLRLDADDAQTLAELLGAVHIAEALVALQRVRGLALDWFTIPTGSSAVGRTIGDGRYRTHTGASIVAVIRADTTVPAPGAEFVFEAGDVAVAIGTTDGLGRLRDLLER
jgi:TrkA domain protein